MSAEIIPVFSNAKNIGGVWGDGEMGRWGDRERFGNGACDGTFFYTELNGFD
ncbi:MAG: hypothetical protein F6K17_32280, partial [Okeania sp. SIO3C4]|nr:hypothetical protein [Okeania sp. SIO3C4]